MHFVKFFFGGCFTIVRDAVKICVTSCVHASNVKRRTHSTSVDLAVAAEGAVFQSPIDHALMVAPNPHCGGSHSAVVETSQSLTPPL
jgi:hypothetical protein